MRVLWVSLVEFPPLCKELGKPAPAHCGWLYSSAKALINMMPDCKLGVMVCSPCDSYKEIEVENINYYLIPMQSLESTTNKQIEACKKAITDFKPDLLHIHGTEHSLARAALQGGTMGLPVIANIQGLAGGVARYADGGISLWDKLINITPLDFYRGTFLLNTKRSMKRRGKNEDYVIKHITDIVGRTQWDHDHAVTVNPDIRYHFMNETLRDSFYEEPTWSYEQCKRHTIFVSNSGAPLKGAHQVIKALPIILRQYPDTVVNFCGSSVMNNDLRSMLHFQGYHLYLRRLVKKLGVQQHVNFLGALSEQQMKQAFLDANVYVMPSAIENSPNSLCEAQILGVPVVASYCGGTPTLVEEGKTGYLYRYEEVEMLAQTVMRLFGQSDFKLLSQSEKDLAYKRHDRTTNATRLVEIYSNIISL